MTTYNPITFIILAEYQLDQAIPSTCYYIAESLSKTNKVIFVEKSITFLALIIDPSARKYIRRFGSVTMITDTFYVYIPYPRLPFDRMIGIFSSINQFKLFFEIKSIYNKYNLNQQNSFFISFNYNSSVVINKLNKYMRSLYYILDDWKEFSFPLGSKKLVKKEDINTIKSANFVVTVSEQLEKDSLHYNHRVKTIKNAVDISKYLDLSTVNISDVENNVFPIVGFVGTLEEWVDLSLIAFIANKLPNVHFLIIGPSCVDLSSISNLSNVLILGPKPKHLIPHYISKMHIGIIPFKINALSKSVSPLKLYEYLATGIPVVSTPMDGSIGMEKYDVFVESSKISFLNRLEVIIADYELYDSRRTQRINFARENSWDQRSEDLISFISS